MKKKKKKLILVISLVLILAVAIIITIAITKNIKWKDINNKDNNVVNQQISTKGKLQQYIISLTNNYYIKYSGSFKDNLGNNVKTIVEYTKSGNDFALRANEIDIHLIFENDKLYSIANKYKMIVKMSKQSFDISEYNLASDIGQIFVKSNNEKINNIEYEVEEYKFNENIIKYYFKDNELKLIKYNDKEIKVIRVEKTTNKELFKKPQGYTNV